MTPAGIIFPLLIAILFYLKRKIRITIWITAVILGGLCGLAGSYMVPILTTMQIPEMIINNLSVIGMIISLVVALLSVDFSK